jgi:uncharacterized low-complexity protein
MGMEQGLQTFPPAGFGSARTMRKPKSIFIACVLVLGIGICSFFFGRAVGGNAATANFERENALLVSLNSVASYMVYSEIAAQLAEGKLGEAKCNANIIASSYAREVKKCLNESDCRVAIQDEVLKGAPELLGKSKFKFTYYENAESCFASNPDNSESEVKP